MSQSAKRHTILNRLLLLAVFIAIGIYIADNVEQLKANPIHFNWLTLTAAFLLTIAGHLFSYTIWTKLAMSFDMHSSFLHAGKAWFLSRLARYLPGKIAILLIRFESYSEHSKTKVSSATILEAYTTICAASILLLFVILSETTPNTALKYAVIFLTLLLFGSSHPKLIQATLGFFQKFFPIPTLDSLPSQKQIIGFSVAQILTMFAHGGALFMVFMTLGEVDKSNYLIITAVFFVAGLIGMLAIFSPSGIGVREAVLISALSNYVETTPLILGSILIRIIGIISELTLTGVFFALEHQKRNGIK